METNYEIKDRVLKAICELYPVQEVNRKDAKYLFSASNLPYNELDAILDHFQRLGFIKYLAMGRDSIALCPLQEAFEFYNRGGFKAHEELLELNFKKLLLEIESLKPSMPDKVSTITTIIANISTALGLIAK